MGYNQYLDWQLIKTWMFFLDNQFIRVTITTHVLTIDPNFLGHPFVGHLLGGSSHLLFAGYDFLGPKKETHSDA